MHLVINADGGIDADVALLGGRLRIVAGVDHPGGDLVPDVDDVGTQEQQRLAEASLAKHCVIRTRLHNDSGWVCN